jgi:hypothetical protein
MIDIASMIMIVDLHIYFVLASLQSSRMFTSTIDTICYMSQFSNLLSAPTGSADVTDLLIALLSSTLGLGTIFRRVEGDV